MSTKKTNPNIKQSQSLKQVAFMISEGDSADAIQSRWENFIMSTISSGVSFDVDELVQSVIRESYTNVTDDLRSYAEKVKFFNECKKRAREYVQGLKDQQIIEEQKMKSLDDSSQIAAYEFQKKAEECQKFIERITEIQNRLSNTAKEIINNLKK